MARGYGKYLWSYQKPDIIVEKFIKMILGHIMNDHKDPNDRDSIKNAWRMLCGNVEYIRHFAGKSKICAIIQWKYKYLR